MFSESIFHLEEVADLMMIKKESCLILELHVLTKAKLFPIVQ